MSKDFAFKGDKRYLSNMYPCKIFFNKGIEGFPADYKVYNSSEHLYQALKSKDPQWQEMIRNLDNPIDTKKYARKLLSEKPKDGSFLIREDWHERKIEVMEMLLFLKFSQNNHLLKKLKKEPEPIVEYNYWNDTFWGICNGVGENNLGKLLMKVKQTLG